MAQRSDANSISQTWRRRRLHYYAISLVTILFPMALPALRFHLLLRENSSLEHRFFSSPTDHSIKNTPVVQSVEPHQLNVYRTMKRDRIKKLRTPQYLYDLTYTERYKRYDSNNIPVVRRIRMKHPHMAFSPIPLERWAKVSNTTCISSGDDYGTIVYRQPYALILGAQKGGSSALAKYLFTHPNVTRTRKELHFLSERMDYYNEDAGGIDQNRAGAHYFRHIELGRNDGKPKVDVKKAGRRVVDATPTYLVKSDRVPHRVLCLCPWARLIALLREPISRAYSQFNMGIDYTSVKLSSVTENRAKIELLRRLGRFDEAITRDYDLLVEVGVFLPESATDEDRARHYGSEAETEAWQVYTKLGTDMIIGRGLYAIQLRHWIQAYEAKNKSIPLLVLNSYDMKENTKVSYRRVLEFLDLPLVYPKEFKEHHKREYDRIEPMSNSTKAFLESIFEPYNRQLGKLLGSEWEGVWQYA